ncbi:MAG: hypothetical protein JXA96_09225 [Sedimentisphaerales bacterium]|nr:hypothetical protein [Sedimentisphaerales bacterium]
MDIISKKKIIVLLVVAVLLITGNVRAQLERALDQTINDAARDIADQLNKTQLEGVKNIAILPLWGDISEETKSYIVSSIQSQIIGGPYTIMERDTQAWENLLSEIEWNTLREDVMNQQTIQGFGKIEGCDAVLYGTIRECATYPDSGNAVTRLTLRLGVVETGEAKWSSGEVKKVKIISQNIQAPPDMNPAVVKAINDAAKKAAESLKSKNLNIKSFSFFPLLGKDQSSYISNVLQGHLTNAGCSPVPVSQMQLQEYLVANSGTRESVETMSNFAKSKGNNALLYGTVNECQILNRKYKAVVRMTLNIVNAETGQSLWSPGEIIGSARLDWQDAVRLAVGDPIVWVIGGLLILVIIWRSFKKLFRSAMRPR